MTDGDVLQVANCDSYMALVNMHAGGAKIGTATQLTSAKCTTSLLFLAVLGIRRLFPTGRNRSRSSFLCCFTR